MVYMFFACGIWCVADVSSIGPSSEQTVDFREEKGNPGVMARFTRESTPFVCKYVTLTK